ncbi:MAG: TonB family protein [Candidatus Omnitrophota bacterium]
MTRGFKFFIFLSMFFISVAFYKDPLLGGSANTVEQETAKLIVGETYIVPVRTPSRVVIGKPEIADISNVTTSEITISAKAPGTTTLVYWDIFGEQSLKIKVFAEDIQDIKMRIDALLKNLDFPEVYTQVAEDEGRVLLLGNVKTSDDIERIKLGLGALTAKLVNLIQIKEEEAVIEIDVQVLELDKDATNTLGFTWPGGVTVTDVGAAGLATAGTSVTNLFRTLNFSRTAYTWKLDTLIQEGKARILSRPRLACQSGKEAQLLVGGEKPILTTQIAGTSGASGTNVDYKEFGIKLKIRPSIASEERIKLSVNVEVSDVGTAEILGTTASPTAKAFPIVKRVASTELFVDNGQTLSIGGLIKQKTEEDLRRLPWLSDVPVLGLFFRQKTIKIGGGSGERGNTELFITITPTIISKREPNPVKKITTAAVSTSASDDITDPVALYSRIIQQRIRENLIYPDNAKQSGFQGSVKLSVHLSYLGKLLDVALKESSGYKMLDDSALAAAKSISSYPPFPPTIKNTEIWVDDIPIIYKLD